MFQQKKIFHYFWVDTSCFIFLNFFCLIEKVEKNRAQTSIAAASEVVNIFNTSCVPTRHEWLGLASTQKLYSAVALRDTAVEIGRDRKKVMDSIFGGFRTTRAHYSSVTTTGWIGYGLKNARNFILQAFTLNFATFADFSVNLSGVFQCF